MQRAAIDGNATMGRRAHLLAENERLAFFLEGNTIGHNCVCMHVEVNRRAEKMDQGDRPGQSVVKIFCAGGPALS
jgi:hypothetical protein